MKDIFQTYNFESACQKVLKFTKFRKVKIKHKISYFQMLNMNIIFRQMFLECTKCIF